MSGIRFGGMAEEAASMKRKRSLIVLAVVLVLLAGVYVYLSNRPQDEGEIVQKEPDIEISRFDRNKIEKVILSNSKEKELVFEKETIVVEDDKKDGDDKKEPKTETIWKNTSYIPVKLVKSKVDDLTRSFSSLTAEVLVEEDAKDLSIYGLDKPAATGTAVLDDGTKVTLYLGNKTAQGSTYYLMKEGDTNVYTVYSHHADRLNSSLSDFRDKSLPAINTAELTYLNISGDGREEMEVILNDSQSSTEAEYGIGLYQLVKPYKRPRGVDTSKLDPKLEGISGLSIKEFVDDQPTDLAKYGLDNPSLRFIIKDKENTLDLSFGDTLPDIKRYNIGEPKGLKLIKEYFQAYKVPEDKQFVPIMFIDDTYYLGAKDIKNGMTEQMEKRKSLATLDLTGSINLEGIGGDDLSGYKFLGVVLTGLINGLNPCSISMLLFFVSMLMSQNKNVLNAGLSFIIGKLITYFLLGTILFNLFIQLDIPWFQTITKVILISFFGIIAVFNINDFFAAKGENYSKIRMQLPEFLRKLNHQLIKKLTSMNDSKSLGFICFGLGSLIAVGEFFCTGQIYLATIIYILQNSPSFNLRALLYFLTYGIAFVIPLVLLVTFIHKGREIFDLSELYREKMHIVKLVNTIFFIVFGIIVLVWF
jgi:cytochrome c biogenesis protein CcdA